MLRCMIDCGTVETTLCNPKLAPFMGIIRNHPELVALTKKNRVRLTLFDRTPNKVSKVRYTIFANLADSIFRYEKHWGSVVLLVNNKGYPVILVLSYYLTKLAQHCVSFHSKTTAHLVSKDESSQSTCLIYYSQGKVEGSAQCNH